MILSNLQQLTVLLQSLLFGVCLGAVFDLLRAFRVFVPCSPIAVLFQDLFYFLTAALASFLFIFEVNDGTVRLFILLAFLLGGCAERCTAGFLFIRLCYRIKNAFLRRPKKERHKRTRQKKRNSFEKAGNTVAQKN